MAKEDCRAHWSAVSRDEFKRLRAQQTKAELTQNFSNLVPKIRSLVFVFGAERALQNM